MAKITGPLPRFEDLLVPAGRRTFLIDVDGTLVPDNQLDFTAAVLEKLKEFSSRHVVYLCTNSRNPKRRTELAKILDLPVVGSRYKKPRARLLRELKPEDRANINVIGDKFLTDTLFAWRINAQILLVKSKLSGRERTIIKIVNWFDRLATKAFSRFA